MSAEDCVNDSVSGWSSGDESEFQARNCSVAVPPSVRLPYRMEACLRRIWQAAICDF